MVNNLAWFIIGVPAMIIASTIHEYAHAKVADLLGDYTARVNGRLSLNPLVHIDPIGLISMLLIKIGWSKPVPVNPYNFKNQKVGMALTAIAGPLSNIVTALITAIISNYLFANMPVISAILYIFIIINLALAVFNLIPIPPLDGSKVLRLILPPTIEDIFDKLEQSPLLIIILFLIPGISNYIWAFLSNIIDIILNILHRL